MKFIYLTVGFIEQTVFYDYFTIDIWDLQTIFLILHSLFGEVCLALRLFLCFYVFMFLVLSDINTETIKQQNKKIGRKSTFLNQY